MNFDVKMFDKILSLENVFSELYMNIILLQFSCSVATCPCR